MTTPTLNDVRAAIAPSGTLRIAINFGNPVLAQKDPATGEARGISADIARELGRRLDLPVRFVTFDAAGKVFAALQEGAWDVAFLAIDPTRADKAANTHRSRCASRGTKCLATSAGPIVLTEKTVAIAVGSSVLTVFSGKTPVR